MPRATAAAPAAPPPPPASPPEANRPVHEIRHRNIRATIWRNQTPKGTIYNVTVSRSYRDGDTWKDSNSFAYGDLMNLAEALSDAHTAIAAVLARDRLRTPPHALPRDRPCPARPHRRTRAAGRYRRNAPQPAGSRSGVRGADLQ